MKVYQLEVTKRFSLRNFRDFLKELYEWAAYRGKDKLKTAFIFSDNDVVHETFLEDVNNMFSSGLVPNLYAADELLATSSFCCSFPSSTGSCPARPLSASSAV